MRFNMMRFKSVIINLFALFMVCVVVVNFAWALSSRAREVIKNTWVFEKAIVIPDGNISTAMIADDAITTAKIDDDAVTAPLIADDAVGKNGVDFTTLSVTVSAAASTGTAACESGALILGHYPTTNMDQLIDDIGITGGTCTVTLSANATADNTIKVVVMNPEE